MHWNDGDSMHIQLYLIAKNREIIWNDSEHIKKSQDSTKLCKKKLNL